MYDMVNQAFMLDFDRYTGFKAGASGEGLDQNANTNDNAYYGPCRILDSDNSQAVAIDVRSLFAPHSVLLSFEGISAGMTFKLDVTRHIEAVPDSDANYLERRLASLQSSDNALGLLKMAKLNHRAFMPFDKRYYDGEDEDYYQYGANTIGSLLVGGMKALTPIYDFFKGDEKGTSLRKIRETILEYMRSFISDLGPEAQRELDQIMDFLKDYVTMDHAEFHSRHPELVHG
jgi:hypothetical protein